jgi:hypothetical protein
VIVSLHVATGAAGGAAVRSPLRAIAAGALLHFLGDRLPHQDLASRRFETVSGAACVLALIAARGPLDAATIGALAGSLPDVEHIVRLPRPGGRKLFPSHRLRGWHRTGGISASFQLFLAGLILGAVLRPARS